MIRDSVTQVWQRNISSDSKTKKRYIIGLSVVCVYLLLNNL